VSLVQHKDVDGVDIIAPFTPNVCIRFISFIFPKNNLLYAFLISVRIAACPAHPILVDSVILIIFGGTKRIVKLALFSPVSC